MQNNKRNAKQEARARVDSFLIDHITAGGFWNDESYMEDIAALAILGHQQAKDALKAFKNSY
jgi:hypothetical protein